MTYGEAERLLMENKGGIAYRTCWDFYLNDHIFFDGYMKRTSFDWPIQYRPSKEDKEANDFVYLPKTTSL